DSKLGVDAEAFGDEVVEFGEDERRKDERLFRRRDEGVDLGVLESVSIEQREKRARVGENQRRPKPSASNSSTRSASVGSPLEKRPLLGRLSGRAYWSSAARITAASLRPSRRAAAAIRCLSSFGRYTVVFSI